MTDEACEEPERAADRREPGGDAEHAPGAGPATRRRRPPPRRQRRRATAPPAHAAKPAAPRPPAAPMPDLAGKTTTSHRPGGAAAKAPAPRRATGGRRRSRTRDPDDTSPLLTRRAWMGLAWGAFSAASAAALAATGRFMFPNVLNEPPQQFKAGFPNEYGMGVDERWKEKFGIWIVRTPDDIDQHASGFYALITICTHLGCTPNYLSAENKFKCPCHGSGFRTDRRQLRRAGAASARARARRAGRRRPDPRRQEPAVPARAGAVDGSRSVPEGVESSVRLRRT